MNRSIRVQTPDAPSIVPVIQAPTSPNLVLFLKVWRQPKKEVTNSWRKCTTWQKVSWILFLSELLLTRLAEHQYRKIRMSVKHRGWMVSLSLRGLKSCAPLCFKLRHFSENLGQSSKWENFSRSTWKDEPFCDKNMKPRNNCLSFPFLISKTILRDSQLCTAHKVLFRSFAIDIDPLQQTRILVPRRPVRSI